tara:strand:- start:2477 stop:2659 length:183 start_codon:yes stop_codon:yes gene_type:complete
MIVKKIILEISDEDTEDLENVLVKFTRLLELLEDISENVADIKDLMINGDSPTKPAEVSP